MLSNSVGVPKCSFRIIWNYLLGLIQLFIDPFLTVVFYVLHALANKNATLIRFLPAPNYFAQYFVNVDQFICKQRL